MQPNGRGEEEEEERESTETGIWKRPPSQRAHEKIRRSGETPHSDQTMYLWIENHQFSQKFVFVATNIEVVTALETMGLLGKPASTQKVLQKYSQRYSGQILKKYSKSTPALL